MYITSRPSIRLSHVAHLLTWGDPRAKLIASCDAAASSSAAGLPNFPTRFAEDRSDMANSLELLASRILAWSESREGERVYRFEREAAVGKLFNGVVHIERYGVPNGI